MKSNRTNRSQQLVIAAVAAFCTYFCMYAFRKPFTAATFEGQAAFGVTLKSVLVISQIAGYMVSKFIGIKVVSEMPAEKRAITIIGLILAAEAALVGFAFAPIPLKVLVLFLNGLPLGMVFGLVLSYLEGRRHTEALSAALCGSFIVASGVVKSVGRWLVLDWGVSEFHMPMLTGLVFIPPLLLSVWMLESTPQPDHHDRRLRSERSPMFRSQRLQFFMAYWPGLSLMVLVFVALTVIRTVRDDFGVEIWRDMGVENTPSVFAASETLVAVFVIALNAAAIWIRHNLAAIWVTSGLMCAAFVFVAWTAAMQSAGLISPFVFMVGCGVGMYIPYVAFHTTVFERIVAASHRPGNLVFLMYVADTAGYLAYALVIAARTAFPTPGLMLPFFRTTLWIVSAGSIVALVASLAYFHIRFRTDEQHALTDDAADAGSTPEVAS